MTGKARRAVTDALNGDIDQVDPALRRALMALSTELDEHANDSKTAHIEIMETMAAAEAKMDARINKVQTLLVSTTVTFVVALATGLLNLIIN